MNRRLFLRNTAIGMGAMAKVGLNNLNAEDLNAGPSRGTAQTGSDGRFALPASDSKGAASRSKRWRAWWTKRELEAPT